MLQHRAFLLPTLSLLYLFSWRYARMSNKRQEESSEPVPKAFPSGKNMTELISDSWPGNVLTAARKGSSIHYIGADQPHAATYICHLHACPTVWQ